MPFRYQVNPQVRRASLSSIILALCVAFTMTGCPPPTSPKAGFVFEPEAGSAPLQVEFTDVSDGGGNKIISWDWDFGDGAKSDMPSPTHTFGAPGKYTVTLTVSNGVASDSVSADLTVTAGSGGEVEPSALFRVFVDEEFGPNWRGFRDRSDAGTAPITHWKWSFGDGETSTDPNPTHMYAQPGWYWVTLHVWNSVGSDTTMLQIAVGIPGSDRFGSHSQTLEHRTVPPRSQFIDLELVAFHSPERDDFGVASCRDCHGKRFYELSSDENVRAAHALMPGYGYRDERCARCHNQGEDILFRSTKYFRANMFEAGSCATANCHGPNGQKPLYAVNQ